MSVNGNQLIIASLILQRNPLRMKRLNDFEQAYTNYYEAVKSEKSKGLFEIKMDSTEHEAKNSNVFGIPKIDDSLMTMMHEDESLDAQPPPSPMDSLSRLPDRKLYLLVKSESDWTLPKWTINHHHLDNPDQPLSTILQQKSNQYFKGSFGIYFVGKAPVAHHLERFADRVLPPFSAVHFFFKAQFVSGMMQIPQDYCWLASEEVKAKVSKGYWGAIKDVISY